VTGHTFGRALSRYYTASTAAEATSATASRHLWDLFLSWQQQSSRSHGWRTRRFSPTQPHSAQVIFTSAGYADPLPTLLRSNAASRVALVVPWTPAHATINTAPGPERGSTIASDARNFASTPPVPDTAPLPDQATSHMP
jgi:hypothetical protein